MPKIKFFVYSNSVMREKNGPLIQEPQTCFMLEFCPTQYSFSLTVGVNEFNDEHQLEHSARLVFVDPDNETLVDTGSIAFAVDDKVLPLNAAMSREMGYVLALSMQNVPIKQEGMYGTNVYVDNEPLGDFPIYIGRNAQNDSL